MNELAQWLAMGGYSQYVWSAYGIVCAVLVINTLVIKRQKQQTRQKLHQWFKRQNS